MRPRLFLDVDGVLNAFGAWRDVDTTAAGTSDGVSIPDGYRLARADGYLLLLVDEHVGWLAELAERYDVIWATMWQARAPVALAPVLGIGQDWDYLDFDADPGLDAGLSAGQRVGDGIGSYKFPSIVRAAGDGPAVWIDDDLDEGIRAWASARDAAGVPTLLVEPHPAQGWTYEQYREVVAFAERLGAGS